MAEKTAKKIKNVFVVEYGEYSDKGISGVFSTKQKAQAFIDAMGEPGSRYGYRIVPYPLDRFASDAETGKQPFFVRLRVATGDVVDCHPNVSPHGLPNTDMLRDARDGLYTTVWAKDTKHAIKIAADRRRVWLATNDGAIG